MKIARRKNYEDWPEHTIEKANQLLNYTIHFGFPKRFQIEGLALIPNEHLNTVLLVNSYGQMAAYNNESCRLEKVYVTPEEGLVGFASELHSMASLMSDQDYSWYRNSLLPDYPELMEKL